MKPRNRRHETHPPRVALGAEDLHNCSVPTSASAYHQAEEEQKWKHKGKVALANSTTGGPSTAAT
jgi:hypothetical protein